MYARGNGHKFVRVQMDIASDYQVILLSSSQRRRSGRKTGVRVTNSEQLFTPG